MKKNNFAKVIFIVLSAVVFSLSHHGLWSDEEEDSLEEKRQDEKIQEQKQEADRLERQREDQKNEDDRLERKREDQRRLDKKLDDERWDREHGR